jgi:RNA polymerase sigma-70 factor (sigma-E family)
VATTDDEDFSAFVAARWSSLVRTAIYLGSPQPEAEDFVQTALLRCYRSWSRVQAADRADAYVYRVLVNTRNKALGRRWHREQSTDQLPEEETDDFTLAVGARADLSRVLRGLSPDHRAVLVLRFVADLTEQQTADALGVAVGTVKSRVSRALASIDPAHVREEST